MRMKLLEYHVSGNCYKIRLLCHQLGLPLELIEHKTAKGETRTPEFLAVNSNGKVPVLELEPGVYLPESNAALWYLAEGTSYLPADKLGRAQVLQWMFFEQYSHEPYIAVCRNWLSFVGIPEGKQADFRERQQKGYAALDVMEKELRQKRFFVGDRYSIADIALYAYTHVADAGGFELVRYPNLRRWMESVRAQPKHIPITA
jgi:glutathione S-transferase